jgi:hypothetical protein
MKVISRILADIIANVYAKFRLRRQVPDSGFVLITDIEESIYVLWSGHTVCPRRIVAILAE